MIFFFHSVCLTLLLLSVTTPTTCSFKIPLPPSHSTLIPPPHPPLFPLHARKTVNVDEKALPQKALTIPRGGSSSSSSTPHPQSLRKLHSSISSFIDRNFFIIGMFTSLTLSFLCPSIFSDASPLNPKYLISTFGVPLIFLLSGLSLPFTSLTTSLLSPLNLPITLLSLLAIPLLNLLLSKTLYPLILPQPYITGLLLLSALPTTVNMCIALTSSCGGNTATAVTNAVIGNVLGVVVTPLWFGLMTRGGGGGEAGVNVVGTLLAMGRKVLVPMVVGQGLRMTRVKRVYEGNKGKAKRTSEIVLLSIVLNSFSNAFTTSTTLTIPITLTLIAITLSLHILYFFITFSTFSLLPLTTKSTVIASSFVVSHKTLAFGLPLIKTVFAGDSNLAAYVAPIMIVHPLQLFVGGFMKERLRKYAEKDEGGISQ